VYRRFGPKVLGPLQLRPYLHPLGVLSHLKWLIKDGARLAIRLIFLLPPSYDRKTHTVGVIVPFRSLGVSKGVHYIAFLPSTYHLVQIEEENKDPFEFL